jgi:hypothetical protein
MKEYEICIASKKECPAGRAGFEIDVLVDPMTSVEARPQVALSRPKRKRQLKNVRGTHAFPLLASVPS